MCRIQTRNSMLPRLYMHVVNSDWNTIYRFRTNSIGDYCIGRKRHLIDIIGLLPRNVLLRKERANATSSRYYSKGIASFPRNVHIFQSVGDVKLLKSRCGANIQFSLPLLRLMKQKHLRIRRAKNWICSKVRWRPLCCPILNTRRAIRDRTVQQRHCPWTKQKWWLAVC